MATEEVRKLRHQMAGKGREYEGHLMRLEGQLLVLRARVERAKRNVRDNGGRVRRPCTCRTAGERKNHRAERAKRAEPAEGPSAHGQSLPCRPMHRS